MLSRKVQLENTVSCMPLPESQKSHDIILKRLTMALKRVQFFLENNIKIYNQFVILPYEEIDKEFCENISLRFTDLYMDFIYFRRVQNYLEEVKSPMLQTIENDLKIIFINFNNFDLIVNRFQGKKDEWVKRSSKKFEWFRLDFWTIIFIGIVIYLNFSFFVFSVKRTFDGDREVVLRTVNNKNVSYKFKNIVDTKAMEDLQFVEWIELNYAYGDHHNQQFKNNALVNDNWFVNKPQSFYKEPFCSVYYMNNTRLEESDLVTYTTSINIENQVKSAWSVNKDSSIFGYCKYTLNQNTEITALHKIIVAKLKYDFSKYFVVDNFIYESRWHKDLDEVKANVTKKLGQQNIFITHL